MVDGAILSAISAYWIESLTREFRLYDLLLPCAHDYSWGLVVPVGGVIKHSVVGIALVCILVNHVRSLLEELPVSLYS